MAKQEYEICDVDLYGEWRLVEGGYNGTMEKVLSYDSETGNYTRLLKFPPQTKVPDLLSHDFCEEDYILEGFLKDEKKDITMKAGYYGSRLPEMKHGPYDIPLGCVTMEIRYQDPSKPIDPECTLLKNKLGAPR
ncbi:MAG: cupin domain-containing protein [Synergistaceae bacterium]|nr:cupin domain-containing protein [Synergistaceae bacterium]